ncbi:KUP/HAK/KT family potassium transporter [Corynebacterium flavescens]|uniref:KUP/HAK/KT family potassium transporter n=1 Tax=Corynebacterium flavescens TaxID=28028 RepID=UPI003F90AAD3
MKISVSPQAAAKGGSPLLALGALGVVFGDIGTSPLYALHTAFSMEHNAVEVDPVMSMASFQWCCGPSRLS